MADARNQHTKTLSIEQRLFGNFCDLWPDPNGQLSARQTWDYFGKSFLSHHHDSFLGKDCLNEDKKRLQETWIKWMTHQLVVFGLKTSGKSVLMDKVTPYPGTSRLVLRRIQHHYPEAKIIHLV